MNEQPQQLMEPKATANFWICKGCDYKIKTTRDVAPSCICCMRSTRRASPKEIEQGGFHKKHSAATDRQDTNSGKGEVSGKDNAIEGLKVANIGEFKM